MKKYFLLILVLLNIANCSELAFPSWYCNTYEDRYYIYSCSYANSKYDSINSSIKNISEYIYKRINLEQRNDIAYRKIDLINNNKIDEIFFTKISLNKNELLILYNEKLECINKKIENFIDNKTSPLVKYKNKEDLENYMSTAEDYIKIINFLSNNKSSVNYDIYERAKNYIKNTKLNISIGLDEKLPQEFFEFLKGFFESNGVSVIQNSENKLYVMLNNRKDFMYNLYYLNSNFEFELVYKEKIQLYNYINLENSSKNNYDEAMSKTILELKNLIENKKLNLF